MHWYYLNFPLIWGNRSPFQPSLNCTSGCFVDVDATIAVVFATDYGGWLRVVTAADKNGDAITAVAVLSRNLLLQRQTGRCVTPFEG